MQRRAAESSDQQRHGNQQEAMDLAFAKFRAGRQVSFLPLAFAPGEIENCVAAVLEPYCGLLGSRL